MNNKMFKVILLVAIFATTQVSLVRVSAQTTETEKPAVEFVYSSGAPMEIGDSVMIHKDSLRYITGERMSSWVYGVPHQIRQLGTKTKPTGVLLRGIYSWIAQGSLIPLNYKKTQEYADAQRAAEEAEQARIAAELAAAAAAEEAARAKMFEEFVEEDTIVEQDTVVPDLPYQVNRFSIGVRGGIAAQSFPAFGFSTMLDLRYAHYWVKSSKSPMLGIMTGVGVGYMQYGQNLMKDNYTVTVGNVAYAVDINKAQALNRQVQLEIPVMFSMVTPKGFFLNAGPKLILPAYAGYKQDMTGVTLTATHIEEGVTIAPNDPLMGVVTDAVENGQNKNAWDVTVGLGAELGYEFKFESGYSLDLGVYATYGINTNTYKDATGEILTITPPNDVTVGAGNMLSIMNAGPVNMSYLDAGLKVTFHFNWDNKK
jgi:hypothetical protein